MSFETSIRYLKEFLEGYKVLYEKSIIHRDIKPENLLLHNDHLKIADFGFSRYFPKEGSMHQTRKVGSPLYMSPQILESTGDYTNKCDIWSLGISFYEMLFGDSPWSAGSEIELIAAIKNTPFKFPMRETKFEFLPEVADLLNRMLKYDEKDRISWEEIFEYPLIFEKIEDTKMKISYPKFKKIILSNHKDVKIEPMKIISSQDQHKYQHQQPKLFISNDMKQINLDIEAIKIKELENHPKINTKSTPNIKIISISEDDSSKSLKKKTSIKIISCMNLDEKGFNLLVDQKYKEENAKKIFNDNKQFVEEHIKLINFYFILIQNSIHSFDDQHIINNDNLIKIMLISIKNGKDEIKKLDKMIKENLNIFNLPEWEAFQKDQTYEKFIQDLKDELTNYDFLIDDFMQVASDLNKETQNNDLNRLDKLDTTEINTMIICVLKFFSEKINLSSPNRNLLKVIESILLLKINEGKFILAKFDFEKYHQSQSSMNEKDYKLKIKQELNDFQLMNVD